MIFPFAALQVTRRRVCCRFAIDKIVFLG